MFVKKIGKDWIAMKKSNTLVMISNIVCVIAMIAMIAVMFMPYWDYVATDLIETVEVDPETGKRIYDEYEVEREDNASIMELTWTTYEHEDLVKKFEDDFVKQGLGRRRDYDFNTVVSMPFLVTLLSAFGIIFCLWKMKKTWTSLFPAIAGFLAVQTLLTEPQYQGGNSRTITLVAAFFLLAAGAVLLVQMLIGIVKWFIAKK